MTDELRPIEWVGDGLRIIDQTQLPGRLVFDRLASVDAVVDALTRLRVRGAPALGAIGAFGVAVAMLEAAREGWTQAELEAAIGRVRSARPTAVNLAWGVDRVRPFMEAGVENVVSAAVAIVAEDEQANRALAERGADWVLDAVGRRPIRVLTHCNTGVLAATAVGTALGVVRALHARGALEIVYVDETRPLLQGSRLTAWELLRDGIDHLVQVDGAAAGTILRGLVDVVLVGADRIAANGDIANKVGTVGLALACAAAAVPFVVVAPRSTVDPATLTGDDIAIENRPSSEVLEIAGVRLAPDGSRAWNPAFDVTPARLISAIVLEDDVIEPVRGEVPGRGAGVVRVAP